MAMSGAIESDLDRQALRAMHRRTAPPTSLKGPRAEALVCSFEWRMMVMLHRPDGHIQGAMKL